LAEGRTDTPLGRRLLAHAARASDPRLFFDPAWALLGSAKPGPDGPEARNAVVALTS
jgi:hypothetical protein